jgi:hypothetical protein
MKGPMLKRAALLTFLLSSQALAQATPGEAACSGTCVSPEDLKAFVEIAREKKCLQTTKPTFDLDPVNIIVDKEGRIFFSGSNPHPYTLRMKWCTYEVQAEGKVNVIAAVQEPATYGFRFRPKAFAGYLLADPFRSGGTWSSAIDAGLMVDAFYVRDFNLNVHVGFRSFGAGLGVDVFKNFGGYVGYAVTWDGFRSNPEAALWFAFW